jgi:uncharacterized RDD family membrane protein YckC
MIREDVRAADGDGRPDRHAEVAARAQAAAAERAHGSAPRSAPAPAYAGLVTRAVAFAIDAAIVNLTGALVGAVVGLALSVLETPDKVDEALLGIGGLLYVVWTVGYFAGFWSTTGQTPGNRLMGIRVRQSRADEPLPLRRALLRFVGICLAAIPVLLGFLPILLNDRRRGLQDFIARTVVVHAPVEAWADRQVRSSSTS